MAKIHIYGDSFDRFDGPQRFKSTIRSDLLAEINALYSAEDEEALDTLMDGLEHSEYEIVSALVEQSEMDDENAFSKVLNGEKVGVYAEESVFGVGKTLNQAKLAYLEVTDDAQG